MSERPRIGDIEGLRAVAVLGVLAYHAAFGPAGTPAPAAWLACGVRGVELFFVISGFCLAYPFLAAWRAGQATRVDYPTFIARRLVRIAPPYLVALSAFAVLSLTHFGLPTTDHVRFTLGAALHALGLDAIFFTSNLPAYNGSFWTIGIEARWYLVCPLAIVLYMRSRPAFYVAIAGCYLLSLGLGVAFEDVRTLPCFLLGIVAADLRIVGSRSIAIAPAVGVLVLAIAAWQQAHQTLVDHGDPLWHAAAFCIVVAAGMEPLHRLFSWTALRWVGIASYSIYLVHQPIVDSLEAAGRTPLLAASAALASGFAFYAIVERPFFDARFRRPAEAALLRLWHVLSRRPLVRAESGTI
jgi:peptidoglycan/LPS O-acetylase OafA/YrhL